MKARPAKSGRGAFTLIELLVLIASIVLIACFLLPAIVRGPRQARAIQCNNNLKQVGLSFRTWAIDNGDYYPMALSTNGVVTNSATQSGPPSLVTNGPGTM